MSSLAVSREVILETEDAPEIVRFEDPVEVARQIVARILEAPDAETVLEQAGVEHSRDVLNETLTLTGVRFQRSRIEGEGPGFYAILECQDGTGKNARQRLVTCGSRNVMAQVYRLQELEALPQKVKIVEGSETAQGYKPLWLEAVR